MRKKWIPALLLAFAMVLAGCGSAEPQSAPMPEEGAVIYYVGEGSQGLLRAPCGTQNEGEDAIRDLFHTLQAGEFPDGHPAVPADVQLDHTAWQENSLVLYLTGAYPQMGTLEETFCRAALTLSMLTVSDVESVIINVDNAPLKDAYGQEVGAMSRSSFVTEILETSAEARNVTLTLYFGSASGAGLAAEAIGTEIRADQQEAAVVLDMLIKGPLDKNHIATIPSGTAVLGVSIRDGICYVNLNEAFRSGESQIPDRLEIYSIVNSLAELPAVDKVQLSINGYADTVFEGGMSINTPLEPDYTLVE